METCDIKAPVKIGDKVRFNPFKGINTTGFSAAKTVRVIGTVIEIYPEHGWFAVRYKLGGVKQRTSFNFSDIGVNVRIHKQSIEENQS